MQGLSVSPLDERYVLRRMSLSSFEPFQKPKFVYPPIWSDFTSQEPTLGRMKLPKVVSQQSVEERIEQLFKRVEAIFSQEQYGKAFVLLEEILSLTHTSQRLEEDTEQLYRYKASAHFHKGMLYAAFGDSKKGLDFFIASQNIHEELVHLTQKETYVAELLCIHVEKAKVYSSLNSFTDALTEVGDVLTLARHYVDVLSGETYASYIFQAQKMGGEIIKKQGLK